MNDSTHYPKQCPCCKRHIFLTNVEVFKEDDDDRCLCRNHCAVNAAYHECDHKITSLKYYNYMSDTEDNKTKSYVTSSRPI